ncbi:hypothetical protein REPUB_Repub16aG0145300 [Reevesia pubescens]
MTERIQEKAGVLVPPNSHLSYVLSITLPQPTLRIKIPKVLVKAMQRRNQTRSGNEENGSKNKKKYGATSKKSFRKKVGSMFSNVFGKNKKSSEANSKGENGKVYSNGDDDDDEMKKLKNMLDSVDMGSEKITGKNSEDDKLNDGVQLPMAVATGFGMSKSQLVKEMVEAGDEKKEKPMMVGSGNEIKGRPRSMRTFSKNLVQRNELELINKAKINNVDGKTDLSVACVGGDKGANTLGTKAIVSLKQAEYSNDLTRFRSKTLASRRKPKIAWSMKKLVGGKSEKRELCKKRILMGGRCRPLNHSGIIQYDENGVLVPEIVP